MAVQTLPYVDLVNVRDGTRVRCPIAANINNGRGTSHLLDKRGPNNEIVFVTVEAYSAMSEEKRASLKVKSTAPATVSTSRPAGAKTLVEMFASATPEERAALAAFAQLVAAPAAAPAKKAEK